MPGGAGGGGQKDLGVQSLRGLAVLLMVAGHVIGGDDQGGLAVADDSAWRFSYLALEDLRMPLFTVLSGYVYALRPVRTRAELGGLFRGKVRRLVVPLVTVGTLLFLVKLAAPDVNRRPVAGDLPRVFVFSYEHLWFLQAIFLIFLLVGLLDALGALGRLPGWGAAFAVACLLFFVTSVDLLPVSPDLFSLGGTLRLLPFFLIGVAAHRFPRQLLRRPLVVAVGVAFVPLLTLRLWGLAGGAAWPPVPDRALSLGVGVCGVLLLLAVRGYLRSRALGWLGGFSFGIYLLHVFGTSGMSVVTGRLGVDSTALAFVLSLGAGLAMPVLFELLLGRYAVVSWGVLGQRPVRRRGSAVTEDRPPTGDAVR
ncbi:acyltransferase family protein [Modestobacter sp. I12A-02628]|uniref:Acyltransferase n=1 Tax=Goekera deserti TaxID=2497753 RepID=A0A7K3WF40_9ACTN|nr:acyltransferase [Goekera deserti]MPQ97958.1 acyltransferase family protein [Goekera deserti]NDI48604.1 acyltransferase family protein [Goekera deserti]NEL55017.1 acyltransferase [Goekera deserti]